MAKKIVLVDDLTGKELQTNAQGELVDGETLEFSYNGVDYALDLSDESVSKFQDALKPFLDNATVVEKAAPVGVVRKGKGQTSDRFGGISHADVKAWAEDNKIKNAKGEQITRDTRGKLAAAIFEQYVEAQK